MGTQVFISLGANMAQPAKQLRRAIALISLLPHTRLIKTSSFYVTAPIGYTDQADFVNAVIEVNSALSPNELMESLLAIESALGRERKFTNGPRLIDLDLLLYGDEIHNENGLLIPHPRMHERAFVLVPLVEISANSRIPGKGRAMDYLSAVTDQSMKRLPF